VSILDWRTLTGGYNPVDVLSLHSRTVTDSSHQHPPSNGHYTTLYKYTCKRPPPEGSFPIFQRCSDTVRVPCLRRQPGYTARLSEVVCF
jgi:hypothetical protein